MEEMKKLFEKLDDKNKDVLILVAKGMVLAESTKE